MDYRPINLCNVIYKILAEVVSNRIIKVLPNIILPNEATFVKGRSIMDNAMIGLDIIHHIHSKYNLNLALKLDMTKAFDRVN